MSEKTLFIGIMSGTSVDAIDVVLVDINRNSFKVIAASETPIEAELKSRILDICSSQSASLMALGDVTQQLSRQYGYAVNRMLEKHGIQPEQIAAIGCHGQTICHAPKAPFPFTMQIVTPAVVAQITQIPVVTGFREMDVALGGEGAPLVPLFHQYLLSLSDTKQASSRYPQQAFLNIGGMANLSLFCADKTLGFDTGPGNVLLDGWVKKHFNLDYDKGGQLAAQGQVNETLLTLLLADPYFKLPAPKSTGREYFHLTWLQEKLTEFDISPLDTLTTLTHLTAITIADSLLSSLTTTQETSGVHNIQNSLVAEKKPQLWLFGGGSHNQYLMSLLANRLPEWQLQSSDKLAVSLSPDDMEAAAFAWLAQRRMDWQSGNLPSVTGASCESICGSVTLPPRLTKN